MKTALVVGLLILSLQACSSAPKPREPTGQWVPVNQPAAQQQAARTEPK
ncbi:hypothetical protein B0G71_8208 [Paraburkholderia sp. BL27I4N3]|nr:hypothetical protein [Paraburkholderia sp. BL27I4N3]REE06530.1 hypothetical protein B0G71_8208 [Paraburkholderia sp. BL27I4N3]